MINNLIWTVTAIINMQNFLSKHPVSVNCIAENENCMLFDNLVLLRAGVADSPKSDK